MVKEKVEYSRTRLLEEKFTFLPEQRQYHRVLLSNEGFAVSDVLVKIPKTTFAAHGVYGVLGSVQK